MLDKPSSVVVYIAAPKLVPYTIFISIHVKTIAKQQQQQQEIFYQQ